MKLPGSWAQGQPYIDDDGKITYVSHMGLIDGQDKGLPRMAGIAFFNHGAMFAAGTVTGQLIEVQTASGKIVKQLPVGFQSPMVFPTPDGKSVLARGYPPSVQQPALPGPCALSGVGHGEQHARRS